MNVSATADARKTAREDSPPARKASSVAVAAVAIGLFLAVWMVFGRTEHFNFVNYDDGANVSENAVVQQGLSLHSIVWSFSNAQVSNWSPLTTLSHMLDCQVFGLRPGAHHLV